MIFNGFLIKIEADYGKGIKSKPGEMFSAGLCLTRNPPLYEHKCNNCCFVKNTCKPYPYLKHILGDEIK